MEGTKLKQKKERGALHSKASFFYFASNQIGQTKQWKKALVDVLLIVSTNRVTVVFILTIADERASG
uniref:Uncharacterized protein n=1 Tax=Solanum tuberosum TaxID=4113 RepID=M1CRY1_SOLTU